MEEGVIEGVGVGVALGVALAVGVGEGVIEGVGVGVALGVALGVTRGVGEIVGRAGFRTTTPRFQTRLLPFFIQVNSRPLKVSLAPNFLQVAPAFGVTACAGERFAKKKLERASTANALRIRRCYCDATYFAPLDLFEDEERL